MSIKTKLFLISNIIKERHLLKKYKKEMKETEKKFERQNKKVEKLKEELLLILGFKRKLKK